MAKFREKSHRLPAHLYKGLCLATFTCCVRNRVQFFTSNEIFKVFEDYLIPELSRLQCSAEIYLFMPDHSHFLLRGNEENSDVLEVVKRFKQKTGFWLSRNRRQVKWQKDFYDHILSAEDQVEKHMRYILENPVRKGLVSHWRDYPFKGSTTTNLDEWTDW